MEETTCSFCHTPLPVESRFCLSCGADLSDPGASTRQRASLKELSEALRAAVAGRYRVTDMLGRGGMGAVFAAEDLRLGRRVAIKVLRPELSDLEGFLARFEREARIAARLDHPNIVPIYEVEQVGDFHYFVMKYVPGKSLETMLAEHSLTPETARRILAQAAAGLGHAHERGVVHRDVKPSNIMVDEAGRVLIADFGISKALEDVTQYTSTGQMVGTPSYLSPEQAQGLPLDGRSDQYALAVVGYQMVVGRLPLIAESVHALLYKHIHETPVPAAQARPEVPLDLSAALQRALAKAPGERFQSMEEFAAAVCPECPTPGPWPAVPPTRHRRGRVLAAALALLALLAAGIGVAVWLGNRGETTASAIAPAPEPPLEPAPVPAPPDTATPDTAASDTAASDTAAPDTAASDTAAPVPPKPRPRPARPRPRPAPEAATPTPPAVPRVGYLTVNAVPYGAVSIDGVEVGDTPVVMRELPVGEHLIRITREGYRPQSVTVTITAGNEVRVSRTLAREQ